MSTPEDFDQKQIRSWYDQHAVSSPDSAGVLDIYNETEFARFGLLYRQEAEWLHFRRIAPLRKNMRVLELGCGAGRWALRIAPFVNKVVGVDFSEEMIKLAREKQRELGLQNVEFCVSAIQDVHSETTFDLVYLSGLTQHVTDSQLRQTLGNMQTMLASNGILIDRTSVNTGAREVCDYGAGYHGIYRTAEELKSLLGEFGFHLTYSAPTYNRMRLPGRLINKQWFQRAVETGFHKMPSATIQFIRSTTWLLERVRPVSRGKATRSHNFFVFKKENHHE